MPNIIGIEARVDNVDPDSLVAKMQLPPDKDGRVGVVSVCDSGRPDTCKAFRTLTQSIKINPDGSINLKETQVGLCALTGVACLQMAQELVNRVQNPA